MSDAGGDGGSFAQVIGESVVDVVVRDGERAASPGGSPLNVAVGLARLGVPTRFLTVFGDDERGRLLASHLEASGVSTRRVHGPTGVAVAELAADGSASYELDVVWALEGHPLDHGAALVHTGSLAAFLEPGASEVLALVRAVGQESVVSLDPNIRPAVLPDHRRCVERFEELCSVAHLVKLSDQDAAWLYPDLDVGQVMSRIAALGPTAVFATLGVDGSLVSNGSDLVTVPAVPTRVVDTIGAGDAFMAGLLHGAYDEPVRAELRSRSVLSPERLRALAGFASVVAARTVARPGADPPWADQVGS